MKKKKNLKIKPTDQNTINPRSHLWDCGDRRGGGLSLWKKKIVKNADQKPQIKNQIKPT